MTPLTPHKTLARHASGDGPETERYIPLEIALNRGRKVRTISRSQAGVAALGPAQPSTYKRSRGQALLIVALMMTILVVFVGLGVDVGNLMGRRAKLQSAVDAAALSAAQLMSDQSVSSSQVITKAYQMLNANGVPSNTLAFKQVTVDTTTSQVRVQAKQNVETFFMRIIPMWRTMQVSADATADLSSYAEINIKPYGIPGVVNELNISVWGPYSWRTGGDGYSPLYMNPTTLNLPEHAQMPYGYLYRIDVPSTYPDDHLQVQIFDADSYNRPDLPPTPVTPVPTPTQCPPLPYVCPPRVIVPTATRYPEAGVYTWCQSVTSTCSTGDARYNTGLRLGVFNTGNGPPRPAFWRVDETRTWYNIGTGIGNSYADSLTTQTQYTLWHFDPHITSAFADPATLADKPVGSYVARYTGRLETTTDLAWYTPSGFNIKLNDPSDGSCNYPNHDCYAREANGNMYFYLYIQSLDGSSENNFDLRAGPVDGNPTCTTPCKVNTDYFNQMNDNTIPDWNSGGSFIFAKRAMPLNLDTGDNFPMLFTQVSRFAAGQTLAIRHFDQDCGGSNPPCGTTLQYQMQYCVNSGTTNLCSTGNCEPCSDLLNNNCYGNIGTGAMGPNNGWYCGGCPAPEKVNIPVEGSTAYRNFFGPNNECASSWFRLQSDPSYSQDTTVWEMPFARPRLIK